MPIKSSTEEFINKSKLKHKNFFDYSRVQYENSHKNVEIVCPIHGNFSQKPYHHLNGSVCPKCVNREKVDTNGFIEKAMKIHKNTYDYSKTDYINNYTRIKIICKIHGQFKQTPNSHLMKRGCPRCKRENLIKRNTRDSQYFNYKVEKLHGNKYDYSNTNFNKNKIKILCKKHGNFYQRRTHHLRGSGCPKCSRYISKSETEFLNFLKIKQRHFNLPEWKKKPVDGIDLKTNTVYEFLGDYYHGNPKKYNLKEYNSVCHKKFGELYKNTFKKLNKVKSFGYNVKYIWESDWNDFKNGIVDRPKIQTIL